MPDTQHLKSLKNLDRVVATKTASSTKFQELKVDQVMTTFQAELQNRRQFASSSAK